ncbi:MAG: hypothetical protein WA126_07395 [Thermodesulfovibrionales bacterium]
MKKVIILCILLALSFSTYSCGGGGAGSSSSPGGENPKTPSIVKLMPSHYVAQTNAFISLHTKVLDGNGKPVQNTRVTYTNLSEPFGVISAVLKFMGIQKPLGMLSATVVKTDRLGIATVKLSSTIAGFVTVQSEVTTGAGIVRDQKTVFFTTATGSTTTPPPTLTLHVNDGNGSYDEPADFDLLKTSGDNTRTIKAVVLDGFGVPFSGVSVTFGSDSPGEVTFDRDTVSTGTGTEAGNAYVVMTVNPAIISKLKRYINIFAAADTNGDGTYETGNMLTLFLEPVTVSSITVSANPSVVAPNGTSTITAVVYLSSGTPVPDGVTVSFTTSPAGCGFVTPFSQTSAGIATATFTAPSSVPATNPCTVTASIGGKDGTTQVRITTDLTVQPTAQTVSGATSGTATYTIYGGVSPYMATSNDAAIKPDITGNIMTVNFPPTANNKTITLTVRDNVGATATATLTITAAPGLSVFPSGTITVNNASDPSDITFTIFGGVAPYTVLSSSPVNYPPVLSENTFTVTAPSVKNAPVETVVFMIRDSLGTTITVTMNIEAVAAQALKVIPTAQTIANPTVTPVASTASYKVIGGIAPYKAFSSNPALVTVPEDAVGNTVQATVAGIPSIDTTVTITIYDSAGSSITASLILDVGSTRPLSVIPSTHYIANPTVTPVASTATFEILGGSGSGTYRAFSGNPGLVSVPSGFLAGNILDATVEGVPSADTTVTITIYDTAGHSVVASLFLDVPPIANLTVIPTPQTISGVTGGTATYNIFGGVPFKSPATPYTIITNPSNSPFVLTLDPSGTSFTVDVPSNTPTTTVTYTIRDSVGTTTTATLNVSGTVISVLPSAQTVNGAPGGTATFKIFGGNPTITGINRTYEVFASNPLFPPVLSNDLNGDALFTVTVAPNTSAQSVTYNIRDSVGNTGGPATLTITSVITDFYVLPEAATFSVGGSMTFTVFGGNEPFDFFVDNNELVAIVYDTSVDPRSFTVIGLASGSVTITLRDEDGRQNTVNVTIQ